MSTTTASTAFARLSRLSPACLAAGVAGLILLLALWMPKRDVGTCIRALPVGAGISIAQNCDSENIARDASNPGRYLAERSTSRTRPVHVAAIAAAAHVLSPVLLPASLWLKRVLTGRARDLAVFYLAALAFNAAVLALAYLATVRLVGAPADPLAAAGLMALIASFDITLAWFWVPHQIIMNLLAPLGATLAFVTGMRAVFLSTRAQVLLGLATAAACLTYGYCLVWPVAFTLGHAWGRLTEQRAGLKDLVVPILPYAAAVVLPILLWVGSFWAVGSEIAYEAGAAGQFSWVGKALAQGNILAETAWRIWSMARIAANFLGYYGTVTIGVAVMLTALLARRRPTARVATDPVILGALVTSAAMLLFNLLQGYHQARLLMFPLLLAQIVILRLLVLAGRGYLVGPLAASIALLQVAGAFLGPPVSME